MKLENYEEIIGMLANIKTIDKNNIETTFSIKKMIELPINDFKQSKLFSLIGKRIGIFNNNGEYKIRYIEKSKNTEVKK